MRPARPHFARHCLKDALVQFDIPGRSQRNGLREGGRAVCHVAVQPFAKDQGGNAQAGFAAQVRLNGIEILRVLADGARAVVLMGIDQPDAMRKELAHSLSRKSGHRAAPGRSR